MEKIKSKLYQYMLNQLQQCLYFILNRCENEQEAIEVLKRVNSDFNILIGVVNCLLIRKEDIFEETFTILANHPIIYCNEVGWKMVKHYFNELKKVIIG